MGAAGASRHPANLESLRVSHVTPGSDSNKLLFQIREGGREKVSDKRVGGGWFTYYSQKWAGGYF